MSYAKKFETENLVIKAMSVEMVGDLHAAIHASVDIFEVWLNWACPAPSLEEVTERALKNIEL